MTTFATDYQTSAEGMLKSTFGVSVTYTPASGSPSTITAIQWLPDQILAAYTPMDVETVQTGVLVISPTDIANPSILDQVTISGAVWAVKIVSTRGPVYELQLERKTIRQVGEGHRKESR